MKVLLIWEMVPETTDLYLLEGDDAQVALHNHNNFGNTVDCDQDANDALCELLSDKTKLDISDSPLQLDGPVTVVLSGFIL